MMSTSFIIIIHPGKQMLRSLEYQNFYSLNGERGYVNVFNNDRINSAVFEQKPATYSSDKWFSNLEMAAIYLTIDIFETYDC